MKQSRIYTKEILEEAVKKSINFGDLCRKLGKYPKGATYQLIKNRVKDYEIDTSHFLGKLTRAGGRQIGKAAKKKPEEYLKSGKKYREKASLLRRGLIESNIEYKCSECGISEWNGNPLTLEVDHKNGDWSDCTLENLRFLCPNCHSQTDTHSGRDKNGTVAPM
jgi:hypothetical protein